VTCQDAALRVGLDAGGRWGSSKIQLNDRLIPKNLLVFPQNQEQFRNLVTPGFTPHRTDVIGGTFISFHSDLEFPCGPCIFQVGFRAEYSYTWSDILQRQNDADVQDFLLMLNLGARF
jgi:hypothetical protein